MHSVGASSVLHTGTYVATIIHNGILVKGGVLCVSTQHHQDREGKAQILRLRSLLLLYLCSISPCWRP